MYTKYVFEFRTVQKCHKCVDLVDLQNAAKTQLFEKFGFDKVENEPGAPGGIPSFGMRITQHRNHAQKQIFFSPQNS